jgi:hypothetical protein
MVQNAVAGLEERGCHRTRIKIFDGQRSILETYWNAGLKHGSPVETKAFLMLLQVALGQAYPRPYNKGSARSCDISVGLVWWW